jgi:adenosine deaminase
VLSEQFHLSRQEICQCILRGIEASWLSLERKRRLAENFERDPAWG